MTDKAYLVLLKNQKPLHFAEVADHINQAKFDHAKEKLRNSQMPITEIAESLGYSDAAHFTRAFHRWSGVSPSVFRKKAG